MRSERCNVAVMLIIICTAPLSHVHRPLAVHLLNPRNTILSKGLYAEVGQHGHISLLGTGVASAYSHEHPGEK